MSNPIVYCKRNHKPSRYVNVVVRQIARQCSTDYGCGEGVSTCVQTDVATGRFSNATTTVSLRPSRISRPKKIGKKIAKISAEKRRKSQPKLTVGISSFFRGFERARCRSDLLRGWALCANSTPSATGRRRRRRRPRSPRDRWPRSSCRFYAGPYATRPARRRASAAAA